MPDILCDYASPVSQTTLTGLSTLPGGHVCVAGERILTYGDSDTNCGIWVVVDPGAWTRATDFDTSGEVVFNQQIVPQNDDGANGIQAGSVFYVATTGTITPGTTAFTIAQRAYEEVQTAGVGLVKVGSDWQQSTTGIIAGSYDRATFDERGNATAGASSQTATTFIEGLRLVWLTSTTFRVEEGAAYVNGTGTIVDLSADTDVFPGLRGLPVTIVANTWYYVYLYSNGGVGDIEVSTQAPVTTPYRGTAREKGPDGTPVDTRRFIGSFYASSTNVIRPFVRFPSGLVRYKNLALSALDLSPTPATAGQDQSTSVFQPPTSETIRVRVYYANGTNGTTFHVAGVAEGLLTNGSPGTGNGSIQIQTLATTASRWGYTDDLYTGFTSPTIRSRQENTGGNAQINVLGYYEGR